MMKQAEKEESYKIKLYTKFLSLRMYCSSKKKELFALSSVRDLEQYRELLDLILKVFSNLKDSMILWTSRSAI